MKMCRPTCCKKLSKKVFNILKFQPKHEFSNAFKSFMDIYKAIKYKANVGESLQTIYFNIQNNLEDFLTSDLVNIVTEKDVKRF